VSRTMAADIQEHFGNLTDPRRGEVTHPLVSVVTMALCAVINLSILRRAALGLMKNNHSHKVGIKNKRLVAGWDDNYRLEILCGS
jgi:hypothetical protein